MIDPVRHRQLEELDVVTLCTEILSNSRNELYMNMRFLDISLSSLFFEAATGCRSVGTDGFTLFYRPEYLCNLYGQGRVMVNRCFLHVVFHCLFSHMDTVDQRAKEYWDLSCDIAMESVIDGLYQKCVHRPQSAFRRETYRRFQKELKVFTAEGIYKVLQKMQLTEKQFDRLTAEFYVDDHKYWYQENSRKKSHQRKKKWDKNREKTQTDMETFSKEASDDSGSLLEQVQIENRDKYDYKQFLRKFSILKEEMQVDIDSFDYIFYTYGLSLYGNMPLVEPMESKEVSRIEDFVIVIDTSMSCSGDLVRRFLEETYSVLCESETYFRKINIHIIQCDDKIQDDHVIESQEEMADYMKDFTIVGQGGTDFRPAFEYVNQLMNKGVFQKLKGLIYFTDGQGIYPVKMPVYDTAFVFIKDNFSDISVPGWAMKLILSPEDFDQTPPMDEVPDDWSGQIIWTEQGEKEL